MGSEQHDSPHDSSTQEREEAAVRALFETAQQQGAPDTYVGKRRWTRYRIGMPLEVALDPSVPAGSWRVITHNISRGGLGFWSKQALSEDEEVFVREWSEEGSGGWMTGHVTYSVLGINGYLVGVSFKYPDRKDAGFDVQRYDGAVEEKKRKRRKRFLAGHMTLRRHCAYTTASASVLALASASLVQPWMESLPNQSWLLVLMLVLAAVFGGAIGWLFVGRESTTLAMIQTAIERSAAGIPSEEPLPEAQTLEVASLRRTALELGRRWKQHTETERLQRERLEEISQIKSNVLSMVSHDLRTPLTSIQMYADMLDEDLRTMEEEDQHRFLGIISEECLRLSRLVDDLLEVQRVESGRVEWEMQAHDLTETIRAVARVFEPIAARGGIHFRVESPETLPHIMAHPDKMAQVLQNLLSNAIKLSPEGGEVRLSAEARSTEILLRVVDNGPGIPRDKWGDVFERFVQLPSVSSQKASGVGLGLFIARQIVETHGGRIWLDSELGQGTEFSISLPLDPERKRIGDQPHTEETAGRVVICDADPSLASMMVQVLREGNFDVHVAHSGRKLLEHISHGEPDVVITDVALPDMKAMDLFDALGKMKDKSVSIVVHTVDPAFEEMRRHGVDMLLPRPTTPEELLQATEIARFRKRGEGRVVLVVNGLGLDSETMCVCLSERHHMPLLATDVADAVRLIQEGACDIVVAKAGAEGSLARSTTLLAESLLDGMRLFVLSNLMSASDCLIESTKNVRYVQYTRGGEKTVAAKISEFIGERTTEPVT